MELDICHDRRNSDSVKWRRYPPDVIPLWVADMDFTAPPAVIEALQARVAHGIFGYGIEPPELREVIVARLHNLYGWEVSPEDLVFIPGVVVGFNLAAQALAKPSEGLLLQTPIYYPMLKTAQYAQLSLEQMQLTQEPDGRYTVDLDVMAHTISEKTRLFLLCNPHNPVGRAFTRQELEGMAELCLRHNLYICSDEIHCDILYQGHKHTPIASLAPEIAQRTITLMAPSKTFNIAGLKCSFAIIQNPELREAYTYAMRGIVPSISVLAYTAALAAYQGGASWLQKVLAYLEANRDYVWQAVADLPGIHMARPEATFLAWLDCREADLPEGPYRFFLEKARVALNDGSAFGPGGEGFVRLNFACCRSTLQEALARMRTALLTHQVYAGSHSA